MELSILTYDVGEKIKCRTRKEDPGWWKAEVNEVEEIDGGLLRYKIIYEASCV